MTCLCCSGIRFRLSVVNYLVATSIWSYRLRRAADWARGSVANADAPLAYEHSSALASRGHLDISRLRNELNRSIAVHFVCQSLRRGHGHSFNVAEAIAHVQLTGSTRDQRAGLGTVLAATRNTSLYSDQPSLFACLLSSLAPQPPISLRQSPQLDNGSEVVLLKNSGDYTQDPDVDEPLKAPVTAAPTDLISSRRGPVALDLSP